MVAQAGLARVMSRVCLLAALAAVVFSIASGQIFAPAPEAAAKVIELTGEVSVLHDSQPWALSKGDMIQIRQVIITGPDGYAKFQVSDGSTFEVFPNSNVIFRRNPGNWRDLLDVFVGRVKVHIQKLGGEPNPNTIHTPSAVISVRGTTFDVAVADEDETTSVAVEEGVVDVRHATRGGVTRTLTAGESIQVYKSEPLAKSMIDKGALFQRIIRALNDALYTVASTRGPSTTGGTGVPTPTIPGQSAPPPAPPPPPPPPPPPH